jgi:hypothetical protein
MRKLILMSSMILSCLALNASVWRCDNDLIGGNGAATPYTYTGYNTTSSGKLIVLVF